MSVRLVALCLTEEPCEFRQIKRVRQRGEHAEDVPFCEWSSCCSQKLEVEVKNLGLWGFKHLKQNAIKLRGFPSKPAKHKV